MENVMEPKAVHITSHDGTALNVWDYGGEGPPLLVCHCTGACARVWDLVVAALDGRFRVLAPDARGHGASGKPAEKSAYAWEHSGRDLLAIMDAFGLERDICAAGHSSGGAYIALAALSRPGAFKRVVLMDAIIGPRHLFDVDPNPLAEKTRRRTAIFASRSEARERFASKPPKNTWTARALDAYVRYGLADRPDGRVELACPPEIEAWHYELAAEADVYERLPELGPEILLITAEDPFTHELVERQARRLTGAKKLELAGCGHFFPQEKPKETAAVLLDWLGDRS